MRKKLCRSANRLPHFFPDATPEVVLPKFPLIVPIVLGLGNLGYEKYINEHINSKLVKIIFFVFILPAFSIVLKISIIRINTISNAFAKFYLVNIFYYFLNTNRNIR